MCDTYTYTHTLYDISESVENRQSTEHHLYIVILTVQSCSLERVSCREMQWNGGVIYEVDGTERNW